MCSVDHLRQNHLWCLLKCRFSSSPQTHSDIQNPLGILLHPDISKLLLLGNKDYELHFESGRRRQRSGICLGKSRITGRSGIRTGFLIFVFYQQTTLSLCCFICFIRNLTWVVPLCLLRFVTI